MWRWCSCRIPDIARASMQTPCSRSRPGGTLTEACSCFSTAWSYVVSNACMAGVMNAEHCQ
eukprot:31750-Eustigmatos_ZCMA.PRE.1